MEFICAADLMNKPLPSVEELAGCQHDREANVVTLQWQYPYDVDLDLIKRPEDLLWIISHLGKKSWPEMTPKRIAYLIDLVAQIKGWAKYETVPHPNEAPRPNHSVTVEREKMTPALRYSIIRRDGHRCRACGFSVQDGAYLHVDHIVAVSKGGRTEKENLQTLCTVCNLGKADK